MNAGTAHNERVAMKRMLKAVLTAALMAAVARPLAAQWPDYPSPNVPRTADGKPNLEGPTPRTADGKPDFSGVWGLRGGGGGRGRGNAAQGGGRGAAAAAGGQRGAAPAAAAAPAADAIPVASFGNAGQGFPGDLPFQPWALELMKKRQADGSKDNPDALCLPTGFLQFHNHPEPRKMIQTPRLLMIVYVANHGLRQIFIDGRKLPDRNDVDPWYYGYSIGRWEGDTLVVETTGLSDLQWLDVRGSPLTDQAKITERFRRPNFGSLEIDITIDDPKAYTKPFTVRVNQRIMPDTELIEFICEERDAKHYVGAAPK
jgi:hypothetical protein